MSNKDRCIISLGVLPRGQIAMGHGLTSIGKRVVKIAGKHLIYLLRKSSIMPTGYDQSARVYELPVIQYSGDIEEIRKALHEHVDIIIDQYIDLHVKRFKGEG